ncbi:hypothetical protein GBA52_015399 [Prunus armeniaca]|nr:hypothetical protein GBA52_015399 [Prunus armeniaca]
MSRKANSSSRKRASIDHLLQSSRFFYRFSIERSAVSLSASRDTFAVITSGTSSGLLLSYAPEWREYEARSAGMTAVSGIYSTSCNARTSSPSSCSQLAEKKEKAPPPAVGRERKVLLQALRVPELSCLSGHE